MTTRATVFSRVDDPLEDLPEIELPVEDDPEIDLPDEDPDGSTPEED